MTTLTDTLTDLIARLGTDPVFATLLAFTIATWAAVVMLWALLARHRAGRRDRCQALEEGIGLTAATFRCVHLAEPGERFCASHGGAAPGLPTITATVTDLGVADASPSHRRRFVDGHD